MHPGTIPQVERVEETNLTSINILSQEQESNDFTSPATKSLAELAQEEIQDDNLELARENAPERQKSARIEQIYNDTEEGYDNNNQHV